MRKRSSDPLDDPPRSRDLSRPGPGVVTPRRTLRRDGKGKVRKDAQADDTVLVVLNMTAQNKRLKFDLSQFGVKENNGNSLVPALPGKVSLNNISIEPFGVKIVQVH